jgi:hypothetical protein
VRIVVGFDVVRSRSIQRSFTVHGDATLAARARQDLVAEYGMTRSGVRHTASAVTLGQLLQDYLDSDQLWKPATVASHRHVVSTLAGDSGLPLPSAVPGARSAARRDLPLARRRHVSAEGVSGAGS